MTWKAGDWVVRRELLADGPWLGMVVRIIEDSPDCLVSYIPEAAPLGFPVGNWPTPDHKHPWSNRKTWQGLGCLMLQRPGDAYAIWHFWRGAEREFVCWYINLQDPFQRTSVGYDTTDLELDVIVYPDGRWELKDDELMEQRVEEGRWSAEHVAETRAEAARITARLDTGERWWPQHWRDWRPDPAWVTPTALPDGWAAVPYSRM